MGFQHAKQISKRKVEGLARKERSSMSLLDEGLSQAAFLSKCLSDENRLRILLFLDNGRKSVTQIADELHVSQPLVSHHLKELKRFLLVKIERSGPFIYYEMTDKKVIELVNAMAELAKSLLANRKTF
jgi:DNA-binding transcriptional ArsR family regulator